MAIVMMRVVEVNLVCVIIVVVCIVSVVMSLDTVPIPADRSQINSWFAANVEPLPKRKGLDPPLVKAEGQAVHIKVGKGGKFKTIQEAVNSIPQLSLDPKRYIIFIAGGTYNERVMVEFTRPYVTFFGDPKDRPTIVASATARSAHGTIYSATVTVKSDYFQAVNIDFKNSAPRPNGHPDQQAVALTMTGDKASFYNCKFYGFQDTLCDHNNKHFYKDCYVEGTVDFFWGNAKSIILNTELHVIPGDDMAMVSANGKNSTTDNSGFSFVHCQVTGSGRFKVAVLGRVWLRYSTTVFAYSNLGSAIKPEGWIGLKEKPTEGGTAYFGEYKNIGIGSKMDGRPKWVHRMTDAEVKPYITLAYIEASKWLLPPVTKAIALNMTSW